MFIAEFREFALEELCGAEHIDQAAVPQLVQIVVIGILFHLLLRSSCGRLVILQFVVHPAGAAALHNLRALYAHAACEPRLYPKAEYLERAARRRDQIDPRRGRIALHWCGLQAAHRIHAGRCAARVRALRCAKPQLLQLLIIVRRQLRRVGDLLVLVKGYPLGWDLIKVAADAVE